MPWIGPAILGGSSLIGGIMGNNSAAAEARKNRQFQERMDNTKYQRSVKDLIAAGLNPMLAYMHGPGSAPSGSVAQQSDVVTPAVHAYLQARLMREQTKNVAANTVKTTEEARSARADAEIKEAVVPYSADNAKYQAGSIREQFNKLALDVESVAKDIEIKRENINQIVQNLQHNEKLQPLLEEYQRLLNEAERLGLSEKEATAAFWESLPEAKWVTALKDLLPSWSFNVFGGRKGALNRSGARDNSASSARRRTGPR